VDGETLILRASVWRETGEHVAESLTKGMLRVVVTGVLKSRSYETKAGEKRTVSELEVEEIGPSLRYATVPVASLKVKDLPVRTQARKMR
jgi:single-strand DNA-binding protein